MELGERRGTAVWLLIQNQQVILLQRSKMLSQDQSFAELGKQKWRLGRAKANLTRCLQVSYEYLPFLQEQFDGRTRKC